MQPVILAIGRLKDGPERALVERYRQRFDALAGSVGLARLESSEIPESRARRAPDRMREEGAAILARAGSGVVLAFDERGRSLSSDEFAARIGTWRAERRARLAVLIGGPDGLDASVRSRADLVLSFGALTLPHALVRILVAEQLYRSLTILAGHPYHRGSEEA